MEIYELQSQYINISTIDAIHKYHLVLRTSMAKFINGIIIIIKYPSDTKDVQIPISLYPTHDLPLILLDLNIICNDYKRCSKMVK